MNKETATAFQISALMKNCTSGLEKLFSFIADLDQHFAGCHV